MAGDLVAELYLWYSTNGTVKFEHFLYSFNLEK
jgi:hypothetical protein